MCKFIVRSFCLMVLALGVSGAGAQAETPDNWNETKQKARGQTVYWNAWGGDPLYNGYISWVAKRVRDDYGVVLRHAKISDTAEAVSRVLAEKVAGNTDRGTVDMIWINGKNFASMKANGLLLENKWAEKLPNRQYVTDGTRQDVEYDFGVAIEGTESPWGLARLSFFVDTARVSDAPTSALELLEFAKANFAKDGSGRVTYPRVPDFHGVSFLKQVLIELSDDRSAFLKPVEQVDFASATEPLWQYLDELHTVAWRNARDFPRSTSEMISLMANGELDIFHSYNVSEAAAAIAQNRLPDTVRPIEWTGSTLGNINFVTIPFNASNKEGAYVIANFLISPQAQARKARPEILGSPSVLDLELLSEADAAQFTSIELHPAILNPEQLGAQLQEPHPSWDTALANEWQQRYGG